MQKLNIYMVYTENAFNQILVFETWKEAFNWCKAATTWSDKEIKENIRQPWKPSDTSPVYSINAMHNPPAHE